MSKFKKVLSVFLTIVMMFTTVLSSGMIAYASMLPLKEVKAYLVLSNKAESELKNMPLDDTLNMLLDSKGNKINLPNNATTVWRYIKAEEDGIEEYKQYNIGKNEKIDLSISDSNIKEYTIELIIGSENQLDENNIRYTVRVYLSNTVREEIGYELYAEDSNGNRKQVLPERKDRAVNTQLSELYGMAVTVNEWVIPVSEDDKSYYFGMSSLADEHPNLNVEIYDFWGYILAGGDTSNLESLTTKLINQDLTKSGNGLEISLDWTKMMAIIYYDNAGNVANINLESFSPVTDSSYIDGSLYIKNNNEFTDVALVNEKGVEFENIDSIFAGEGVQQICIMLKDGYSIDTDFYCVLNAHGKTFGNEANNHILKAVKGHYNSLEEANESEDIKEQLIPSNQTSSSRGYKANYNYKNGGVPFTVFFDDDSVWKVLVLAMGYESKYDESYVRTFSDKPIIGEADPWLRVQGAESSNGKKYDTYVVENGKNINMDTYYGYGYQTIFINDANADLSTLKPEFWYVNTDRVYAVSKDSGNRVDENHTRNFNDENQQYTGIIIDKGKENERNYWVTFKKLNNNGPELYVYGPNEREVILDEYFEFKHDILIANIGNAPLKDINVELLDAQNVKLDPYWNVGGNGNDTLAAFTTTSSNTKYGELPNLAKVRLLPDGKGDVKGKLKITATGQKDVIITLKGYAQNPEITTVDLSDAVKYVPYQQIIATNNIHSDWISTQFSIVEGDLPDGVILNVDTGEIYGVPKVPDGYEEKTYTFTVQAEYFIEGCNDYFEPSRKEFALTVKPNTDKNVYDASDENENSSDLNDGYTIKQTIGTQTGDCSFELKTIEDTVFTSYGHYDEFVGLWLNGEPLESGVDYDSESGSTKITIKSQTFENKVKIDEANTIAMEFRNNDNELNRTAQNFTVKTETSVDKVIAKIAALPSNITLNDKSVVQAARSVYDSLSSADEKKVTNYSKLTAAEATIARLEKEEKDRAATNNVISIISAFPSNITLNDKQAVNNARNAYNALTSDQKKLVTNYAKLQAAEDKIVQLEAEAQKQAKVNAVIVAINAIPDNISLKDKETVENARAAYDALAVSQQSKVVNYSDLTNAEATIFALEAQENASKKDKAAADKVIDLVGAIPSNVTLDDKDIVTTARGAYDALTDTQKNIVTNYDVLTAAEVKIAELEYKNYEEVLSVTFVGILVDKDCKALSDMIVEIHSVVQTCRTDENGSFQFNNVEIGKHIIYVKDANGNIIAQRKFNIKLGSSLDLNGNEIIAENGSVFTAKIQLDNGELSFLNVEDGNKAPVVDTNKGKKDSEGIYIDEVDKSDANINHNYDEKNPQTGDDTNLTLWIVLLIVSLCGLVATAYSGLRKRKYVGGHSGV